jgi:hypothetical protein
LEAEPGRSSGFVSHNPQGWLMAGLNYRLSLRGISVQFSVEADRVEAALEQGQLSFQVLGLPIEKLMQTCLGLSSPGFISISFWVS